VAASRSRRPIQSEAVSVEEQKAGETAYVDHGQEDEAGTGSLE
jgi:hypothetical protein